MRYLFLFFISFHFLFSNQFKKIQNVVIDKKQNIMWQDNLESTEYLEDITLAKTYCDNLILNGYIDWKMASVKQLQNIVDITKKDIAIKSEFKFTTPTKYWTKTPFVEDKNKYWYIDFKTGEISYSDIKNRYTIRCIRDIK